MLLTGWCISQSIIERHVKDMSSHPGSKRKPTVAIKDDVYEKAKNKAAEKGLTLVDYVNETILQSVEKDTFMKTYAPHIEKISTGDTIILRDNKIKKLSRYISRKEKCTVQMTKTMTVSTYILHSGCQKLDD